MMDFPRGAAPGGVKALFFDVFGTLVDWRGGVARAAELVLRPLGYALDWIAFADAWREQYQPSLEDVRSSRIPYAKLDVLHRRTLQKILPGFGVDKPTDKELDELTLAWHRLDAGRTFPPASRACVSASSSRPARTATLR
jgi:2-haloacid dehalogenase